MTLETVTGANIVSHIESISFDGLEGEDLHDLIYDIETRAETAVNGSNICQSIPEEDLKPVIYLIAEMTVQCITVLGLGNEVFFIITDEDIDHTTNYSLDNLSIVEIAASDIITIISDLRQGNSEMVEEVFGKIIGHEVCHSYIARNFPDIHKASRVANTDPESDGYKSDPGEKACEKFGERFSLWRKKMRNRRVTS